MFPLHSRHLPGRQLPNVPVPAAWQAEDSVPTALLPARDLCRSPGVPWVPPGGLGQPQERWRGSSKGVSGILGCACWFCPPFPPFPGNAECNPALFQVSMLLLNKQPGDAASRCQHDTLHLLPPPQLRGENSAQFPPSQRAI